MNQIVLRDNNLYINGRVVQLSATEQELVRDVIVYKPTEDDLRYLVKQGDRLDTIAWRQYGVFVEDASKYWWVIADANNIINPLDITEYIGTEIVIPNIFNFKLLL